MHKILKILKITLLLIIAITSLFILWGIISFSIPEYNKEELRTIVLKKTGFKIKDEFKIIDYNNTGFGIDFAETYRVKLSNRDFNNLYNDISRKNLLNWKKTIGYLGYRLILSSENIETTCFIFSLDLEDRELNINITDE